MIHNNTVLNGLLGRLGAGNRYLFGFSIDKAANDATAYRALDTDVVMTAVPLNASGLSTAAGYALNQVGAYNEATTVPQADKIHAVLIFDTLLTEADWLSMKNDWFGVLLEEGEPVDPGLLDAQASGSAVASGTATAAVDAPAPPAIVSEPLTNNTGTLLANQPLVYAAIYHPDTGALVVRKTGLTTDAAGCYTFTDPAIQPGVYYLHDWLTESGTRRMPAKAAQ
ncbi:MAG: hypothetical protein FWC58_00410 [Desulfobulbus sp.]|nr:hypothetical protein [Desulfobulbus sp.]